MEIGQSPGWWAFREVGLTRAAAMRARLVECGSTASDNGFCATVGRTTGLSHSTQLRTEFGRASRVSSRFLNLHILPSQGPRYPPNTLSLHISRARKRIPRLDPSTLMYEDSSMSSHTLGRAAGHAAIS